MTNWRNRRITEVLLLAVLAVLIGWDIYAAATSGHDGNATISEITMHLAYEHPIVAFMLGCVAGHLTWPSTAVWPNAKTIITILVGLIVAGLLDHWFGSLLPALPFLAGFAFGHLTWAQSIDAEKGVGL